MIPYRIKQSGKELANETDIRTEQEGQKISYLFSDQAQAVYLGENDFDCNCPPHLSGEEPVCAHIYAASLLHRDAEHAKKSADFKKRILEQEAETLLTLFQTSMSQQYQPEDLRSKETLLIHYQLKIKQEKEQHVLAIELKVGPKRTYIVKNIRTFLRAVSKGQLYNFTKTFSYDPSEHTFGPEDTAILKLLSQISEMTKMFEQDVDYWTRNYSDDKMLILPASMAVELCKKLIEQPLTLAILDSKGNPAFTYQHIQLKAGKPDFSYTLTQNDAGDYELELDMLQQAIFLEAYQLIFCEGVLYIELDEIWTELPPLIAFHQVTNAEFVQFGEQKLSEMISYVLPTLKKSGTVMLDPSISGRIIQEPLEAKMTIMQTGDRHEVQLRYHYGSQIFDPFKAEENDGDDSEQVIIRDIEKESYVMNLIEQAPLHFVSGSIYVSQKEEELYQFYYHIVPRLSEYVEIYMEDGLEEMIEERVKPVLALNLEESGDFLAVNFEFEGIARDEIQQVLESLRDKQSFHRLKNGRFLSLEAQSYQEMEQVFDLLDIRKKDVQSELQVPLYRGVQIYEELGIQRADESHRFNRDFKHLLEDITEMVPDQYPLPKKLSAELRDYQLIGYQWLRSLYKYRLGGVLADDMGLGKTIQTIAFLTGILEERSDLDPILIVTPASLLYNWQSEWQRFAPEIPVEVIYGDKQQRLKMIDGMKTGCVYLISYPSVRQDEIALSKKRFACLILDESQTIKNYQTKASLAVRSIKASARFALSGTPLENRIDELWTIFQTLMPGFFPALQKFKQMSPQSIAKLIRPFLMRRLKQDVVKELPEKIETNLLSELTDEQKTLYLAYLEKIQQDLLDPHLADGEERMKLLAGLTRLRQICCDPRLFLPEYQGRSGKFEQLFDTIKTAEENKNRLLIFSQFTGMLRLIRDQLEKEGHAFYYMDGKTPVKERLNMVTAFNEGQKSIFLISLKAGGTGLNLIGADTVILYDLWWNPAVEEQAASRAHRIGQKKVVQVIRMITKGTIEEKIYALQQKKQALVDEVIQPGEKLLTKLTLDEMKEILMLENERKRS
ncbi:DEAD/DEAH box helicase [Listeria ilorinensis]|uniref:DEAD/DEAH box helicase n=1 Tax=Listeria ilorinensis TaxID=2867439 RepID=UPI001EF3F319|nr:DEAD/DEAH box helicase [Listeria ilorinensis]